jgi:aerobic-type carbon monoxide dehydrogenase small subunit (CoxS/CutS family)
VKAVLEMVTAAQDPLRANGSRDAIHTQIDKAAQAPPNFEVPAHGQTLIGMEVHRPRIACTSHLEFWSSAAAGPSNKSRRDEDHAMPSTTLHIVLNGAPKSAPVPDASEPLLYVLRNQLDQIGPKFACGISQCGACTVLVNGNAVRSCVLPCSAVASGADVTTLDGLGKNIDKPNEKLHPLQSAFIAEQAAQCGFCMNGMVLGAKAWLDNRIASGNRAVPTDEETRQFLSGKSPGAPFVYICRCGAHNRIIRAIQRAAQEMTQ